MSRPKNEVYDLPAELQHPCKCGADVGQECRTASGKPTRTHATRSLQLCRERYIKQPLKGPDDKRMECAQLKGHPRQHRNARNDLRWSPGAELDLNQLT